MSRLAVIGTFYGRHENDLPLLKRLWVDSTRKPDETWLMCEGIEEVKSLTEAYKTLYENEMLDNLPEGAKLELCPTPKLDNDSYAVIPYSNKINIALDQTDCDLIVYLDNGSMPREDKFMVMADALERNPEWGAVYCTQKRTGMHESVCLADAEVGDAYCGLNYTQVMHRKTSDRWPLDMNLANPDLADGWFWRRLHLSLGVFFPVGGNKILDEHHIPNAAAAGC